MASRLIDRLGSAAVGMGISLVPLAAIAALHILFAPKIVAGLDPQAGPRLVSEVRRILLTDYVQLASFVLAYWLLAGIFGKGQILRVRSANVTLAFSASTFALAVVVVPIFPAPGRLFEVACPLLGISQSVPFGFDALSRCETFGQRAALIVLLGIPFLLLAISSMLRILVSRSRWKHNLR